MRCPSCQFTVESDSKFCRHCGAKITPDDGPKVVLQETPHAGDPFRDPALEAQVWSGRPAWRAFCGGWMAWFIGSALILWSVSRVTEIDSAWRRVVWVIVLALAIVVLVRQALIVLGQQYRLTTQRLFIHRGILTRITDQIELVRVDDVRIRQGVIDRIVNTGDIEIISSDKTDEALWLESIAEPAPVAESLRKNVRLARGKGTLFVENV